MVSRGEIVAREKREALTAGYILLAQVDVPASGKEYGASPYSCGIEQIGRVYPCMTDILRTCFARLRKIRSTRARK